MDSQPANKRARTEEDSRPGLSPWERKRIFDSVYKGNPSLDEENDLFKKSYEDLEREDNKYRLYEIELGQKELNFEYRLYEIEMEQRKLDLELRELVLMKQKADMELNEAYIKAAQSNSAFLAAKSEFFIKSSALYSNDENYKKLVNKIGDALASNLVNLVEGNLNEKQKILVARIITEYAGKYTKYYLNLLEKFDLEHVDFRNCRFPMNDEGSPRPHLPSSMNAVIQKNAAEWNKNHVFAFPNEIPRYFPVVFCHPVFVTFSDIINNRIDQTSSTFIDYNNVIDAVDDDVAIRKKIDRCIAHIVDAVLNSGCEENEDWTEASDADSSADAFVNEVAKALTKLFPEDSVKTKVPVRLDTNTASNEDNNYPRMDTVVQINSFPFILVEAKNYSYSINAVLQGLQYYGMSEGGYIDNDPCFLITLDKGIFYVYGVATVNCRVVCSCLLSLEFTSYLFSFDGFIEKLWKCFGALYYFYTKFTSRLSNKADDAQHLAYSLFKSTPTVKDEPYPAIFSVRSREDLSKRIMISFNNFGDSIGYETSSIKPCLYLVKTLDIVDPESDNENAVSDQVNALLKLDHNYDIEAHEKMAAIGLAPKIIGHETLCGQYQIILMEYSDSYETLHTYIKKHGTKTDRGKIIEELQKILDKLRELELIHGDFRSTNIIVKKASDNPALLEDVKLIDFELSGKVNTLYPNLSFLNKEINWPKDFMSYTPRKFEHDLLMFENIKNELYEKKVTRRIP